MKYENYQKATTVVDEIARLEEHLKLYQNLDYKGVSWGPKLIDYITDDEKLELNKRVKKDLQKKINNLKNELEPL